MTIPNVPPKAFSLSAVMFGYLLIDNLTANEQNALGYWLQLASQILCTNAAYKFVVDERMNINQTPKSEDFESIEVLKKMVDVLNKEIEILKREK